MLCENDAFFSL